MATDIFINPALSFLAILNLLGAGQGLLLTLALLTAKGDNKIANSLLAALTLTTSIIISGAVLITSNYVFVFPHLSRLHHPFVFLAGPLIFLYRSEEHTSELQSLAYLVCRLLLEKKKNSVINLLLTRVESASAARIL